MYPMIQQLTAINKSPTVNVANEHFPVQIRLRPRAEEPLQVTEEEFRANLARDKAARADAPGKIGA